MLLRKLACLLVVVSIAAVGCGKKNTLPEGQQAMADEIKAVKGIYAVTPDLGVTSVNLQGTGIDDAFVQRLAAFPDLQRLSLRATKITDQAIPSLVKMKKLNTLDVGDTALTDKGKTSLREAFGQIQIVGAEGENKDAPVVIEP
jgi:hypothetical protein